MSDMANLVRVLTASTGTATMTLGAAYSALFMTSAEAGMVDGRTYTYLVTEGNDWELGKGVYTASGTTLSRVTVLASRISGTLGTSKITLSGTAQVRIVESADDMGALRGTRAVTGTTDTLVQGDLGRAVTYSNAAAIAVSIAQAGTSSSFLDGWTVHIKNTGAGAVTITPTTSTINGGSTLVLAQNMGAFIWSDGTNYHAYFFPVTAPLLAANNLSDVADAATALNNLSGVSYAAQSLTATQQSQARANIGAVGRNRIINPNGQINQTPAGSQTDGTYDFDQWLSLTQTGAITASQLVNVEDGMHYMMRSLQAQASAQRFGRIQWLEKENCIDLRGQAVTLSARVRMSATTTLRYAIIEWTGTDNVMTKDVVLDWTNGTFTAGQFFTSTLTVVTATGSMALTANTLANISLSGTIGSSADNIAVFFWTDSTQAQNVTLDISKVHLELGSVATPLASRSITDELALCQRYFYNWNGGAIGFANGSGIAQVTIQHPVPMLKAPTVAVGSASATLDHTAASNVNPSSPSVGTAVTSPTAAEFRINNYSTLTAGQAVAIQPQAGIIASLNARM